MPRIGAVEIVGLGSVTAATTLWRALGVLRATAVVKATFDFVPGGAMTLAESTRIVNAEAHHANNAEGPLDSAPGAAPRAPDRASRAGRASRAHRANRAGRASRCGSEQRREGTRSARRTPQARPPQQALWRIWPQEDLTDRPFRRC